MLMGQYGEKEDFKLWGTDIKYPKEALTLFEAVNLPTGKLPLSIAQGIRRTIPR